MIYAIIPTCGGEHLGPMLESLARHTDVPMRAMLVVNDPAWLGVYEDVADVKTVYSRVDLEITALPRRIGYVDAVNLGWQHRPEDAEYICCLNDDLIFEGPWVQKMLDALQDPKVVQVGASVKKIGKDAMWGDDDDPQSFAEGWCWMARKKDLEWAGRLYRDLLDRRYSPGYCDDMDLSLRLRHLVLPPTDEKHVYSTGEIVQVDVPIKHLRSQTFGQNRPGWGANRCRLIREWGCTIGAF